MSHHTIVRSIATTLLLFVVAMSARSQIRPPAVPLVTHDPYFSVWSFADRLTDDWPRHWTGAIQGMAGLIRIDGKAYRFCGNPRGCEAADQKKLAVTPTRSTYSFEAGGIAFDVSFLSPLLPDDLDLLSRPITYLTVQARSVDGKAHEVEVYVDASGEWCVDKPEQVVACASLRASGMPVARIGTVDQPVLAKKGDDLRIDWGHLYLGTVQGAEARVGLAEAFREEFAASGKLPRIDPPSARPANDGWPVVAAVARLGRVRDDASSATFLIGYDDGYSIELMKERLRPWWRKKTATFEALLGKARAEQDVIVKRCVEFDAELERDLVGVGGQAYADLAILAYRQCIAAHKLVIGPSGEPLFFSKENFSNGCIATVDVTYPSAPLMLALCPTLLRGMLIPVLDYAASDVWKHPFAPHDLGTYPLANGQVYGGGATGVENQMPVEECGNMLLLVGALAHFEGSTVLANRYWPTLTKWAEYLAAQGFDPENQLCTDDFAGHLAHNANLSLKAILALGAYARLCEPTGHPGDGPRYRKIAEEMAAKWIQAADDGERFRLAFDKPGTWSQKYNLVWDRLLGLDLFPKSVAEKEMAAYRKLMQRYGLPLDSRKTYAKTDWTVWTATLTGDRQDFEALVAPVARFANETPDRIPLTDWYESTDGKCVGFRARSVVGGLFLPMLGDEVIWRKWVKRSQGD